MGFVIHWHESAMELHVFPIPIPPPTSLSTGFLWVFPVHQARALVSEAWNLSYWTTKEVPFCVCKICFLREDCPVYLLPGASRLHYPRFTWYMAINIWLTNENLVKAIIFMLIDLNHHFKWPQASAMWKSSWINKGMGTPGWLEWNGSAVPCVGKDVEWVKPQTLPMGV